MAGLNHSPWPGLDPVESGPQPSRPSPAFGAPDIGQRYFKEDSMPSAFANGTGDHTINGGYGHRPNPTPPPQEPAK